MDEAAIATLASRIAAAATGRDTYDGVWRRNVETVLAFEACASQWRAIAAPAGRGWRPYYTGLDYAGARVAIDAIAITVTPELWAGLRIMEAAARDELNRE